VCAYIENPVAERVAPAERELFYFLQNSTGHSNFRVFTFDGRRVLFRLLEEGQRLRTQYEGARDWLLNASQVFGEILLAEGLLPNDARSLIYESAKDMLADMQRNGVDTTNLLLGDLGMFADPAKNLKLMTMHGSKGRQFSAVAVIAVLDGMIPYHNYYNPLTRDGLDEGRRLFYVSITRAKRLLMLFTGDDERAPSRFLAELGMTEFDDSHA